MSTLPSHLEKKFQEIMSWKPSVPTMPVRICQASPGRHKLLCPPLTSFNIIFIKFIIVIKFILYFLSQKTSLHFHSPHFHWLANRWFKLKITFNEKKPLQLPNWLIAILLLVVISAGAYLRLSQPKLNYNPYFYPAPKEANYSYQNKNNDTDILVGRADQPNVPSASFAVGHGKKIEFMAESLVAQKVSLEGSQIVRYQNVRPETDITYKILANGLKENIIFKSSSAFISKSKPTLEVAGTDSSNGEGIGFDNTNNSDISFTLSLPSSYTTREEFGAFTFYDENQNYLFHFEKPFMIDAKNVRSEEIEVLIEPVISNQTDVINLKYTLKPNPSWLTDPKRQYPIALDPTVIYDTVNPPIAYWKFDEASGTTINDSSGNSKSGTLGTGNSSPTWITTGKIGNALSFDGSNDYVNIGSTLSGIQTIEFWINPGSSSTSLIDLNGTSDVIITANKIIATGFSSPSIYVNGIGTTAVTSNQWQHIAITTNSPATGSTITIGKADSTYFSGKMDDIRIYNYVRSIRQIALDYNAGAPISWWKFDEGASSTAYDEMKNNNGTLATGNSSPTWSDSGKYGKALSFSTNDYLTIGNTINSLQTISFWANPGSTATTFIGLSSTAAINISAGQIIATGFSSPTIYVNGIVSSTVSTANQWVHIAVVTDSAVNANSITIGKSGSSFYNGLIDELKVYSYALTATEIKLNSNQATASRFGNTPDINAGGSGPIAYWKMDEGIGTTAYDISGNGLNLGLDCVTIGTTYCPAWTANGKIGSGIKMNPSGSSGLLVTADNNLFDFAGADSFTIESWLKHEGGSGVEEDVFNKTGPPGYKLVIDSSGNYCFRMDDDVSWGPDDELCTSGYNYADYKWHHLAAIKNGTSSIKIYVDGMEKSVKTGLTATGSLANAADVWIGTNWPGIIDQVKVYNYARSTAQIHADMGGSPISYWKFDEGYGTTVYDEMKNNNGTFATGNSAPTWSDSGKYGKALSFSTNDYLTIGSTISSLQTITFWANPGSTATTFIGLSSTAAINISAGQIIATGFSSPIIYVNGIGSSVVSSANQWVHIAVVTNSAVNASSITIGKSGSSFYTGSFDEIKIYNYPLTSDEIKIEANQSSALRLGNPIDVSVGRSGPIGFWKFDEGVGTTAYDISGNNYHGSLPNGSAPTWTTQGKIGNALSFNGSTNYINIGTSLNSYLVRSKAFSLEAWIKTSTSANQSIINGADWSNPYIGIEFYVNSSGTVIFALNQNDSKLMRVTTTQTVNNNKWHFITASYNGNGSTSGIAIYIDGKAVSFTSNYNNTDADTTSTTSLQIGARDGSNVPFSGIIDQVKIYGYARSYQEVIFDYNKGKPFAYWKLDEKSGTSIYDESENNYTGTVGTGGSAPTHVPAMIGWGLSFDGVDDSVNIGLSLNNYLLRSSLFTITAWVKKTNASNGSIINNSDASNPYIGMELQILSTGYMRLDINQNADKLIRVTSTTTVSNNQWHFVAVTYTGSGAASGVSLYLDGVKLATTTDYDNSDADGTSTTNLQIGARDGITSPFGGIIDDVRVYNYVRSADEVKIDYVGGAAVFK